MKYSVKFQIIKRKNSGKNFPLAARVSYSGTRIDIRLGISIPETCWNTQRQLAVAKSSQDKILCANVNKKIVEITEKIDNLFARCELLENRAPNSNEIKAIVNTQKFSNTITELVDSYLKENSHLELSTVNSYKSTVRTFVREMGDLTLGEISKTTMHEFCLKSIEKRANNTVKTQIAILFTLLNFAKEKEIYNGDATKYEFKFKVAEKPVIHLSEEQLIKLFMYVPDNPCERRAQLLYLFCCFTGLRYSDARKLNWANVYDDYVEIVTKKTVKRLKVELNVYSRKILEWAKSEKHIQPKDETKVFYAVTQDRNEEFLRQMARKLHFDEEISIDYYQGNERIEDVHPKWQLITSHTARKTFVVTALTKHIPTPVIMRWTGHKTHKALSRYMDVVDYVKKAEMSKFDEL